MAKTIATIVADTLTKSAKLFQKGSLIEEPTRIDVLAALIIDATTGKLKSRSDEVIRYVREYEDVCKYAKPVEPEVKEIYRAHF
ncbi:hypothetical protein PHYNN_137 [Pantoea phage Phynn]|nr:hypothetical protein PHYNN_137 [Pantoea phage Phynn]